MPSNFTRSPAACPRCLRVLAPGAALPERVDVALEPADVGHIHGGNCLYSSHVISSSHNSHCQRAIPC
eukprot:11641163-Heterocapsa_arctica.AAC.1